MTAPRGPNAALAARAPGKVNLCLYLGQRREDGLHELVSVVQSVSLADELVLEHAPAGASGDIVECALVPELNIAERALEDFRARTGSEERPQHLLIRKVVPVAGGMGGGSADAAAALRLAAARTGMGDEALLMEVARGIGADVPAQVRPGRSLVQGAGERVKPLPDPPPFGILILPSLRRLSTPEVYDEADRLGLGRDPDGLAAMARLLATEPDRTDELRASLGLADAGGREADGEAVRRELDRGAVGRELDRALMVNELEPAALSLCPELDEALDAVRATGADVAMVSGSGPTVVGLFTGRKGVSRAAAAARALSRRDPTPVAATPVGEDFGRPAATDSA